MRQTVLITGGTGMVGQELLPKICSEEMIEKVVVLTRGAAQPFLHRKIQILRGDVCKPNLGLREASRKSVAADITTIIHGAAETSFDLKLSADRQNRRLFIGCRSHVMAVVNAETGAVVVTLPIGDHVDATAFDPTTTLIFNSTGDGNVYIFHEDSPDQYSPVGQISTRPGSKTMALDLKTHRLFVPAMGPSGLEILLFAR